MFVVLVLFFLYNYCQRPRLWALAVSVARNVPFAGAFAVVKRQGELKISEANAGAKLPECIACPDLSGPASQ